MNAYRLLLAALCSAALAACTQQPATPKDQVVATIDGKTLSRNTYETYVSGVTERPFAEVPEVERQELLEGLVRAVVVANEAERTGVTQRPEVAAALEIQRLTLLQRATGQDLVKDRQPSEDELRAEYDLRVADMEKTQYRLSHIAVETSEAAARLIEQLDKGANFAALARQHSLDNNTKAEGGDLLWSTLGGMPPTFAVAVREMKKGEHSKTPLRTDVAWHVIRLTETRDATPPPFDSVREQLVQAVQQKQFEAWVDGLMTRAKVTKTP
jgi:peptidyl-prolyl cis-trans isomerase C